MNDKKAFTLFVASLSFGLFIGICYGSLLMDSLWRGSAVDDGVAEYYLDDDHNRQWRWIIDKP